MVERRFLINGKMVGLNAGQEGKGLVSWSPGAILASQFIQPMGKGDKKSKKGKIWKGSYGVSRNKRSIKARLKRITSKPATPAAEKPKAKRATRKKEAAAE